MSDFVLNFEGKILVLVHRSELVEQTIRTFGSFGILAKSITSKDKYIPVARVYVAMVDTIYNRLKKQSIKIDLIICDECHRMDFNKVIDIFECKVLGLTATPVLGLRKTFFKCRRCGIVDNDIFDCHNQEAEEWGRDVTLSEYYDTIVVGRSIAELIEDNKLIQNIDFVEKYVNTDSFTKDSKGEFTTASQNKEYNKESAVFNVLLNYQKYCLGKKTIIFNNSCENNLKIYESFSKEGYNVKMFDSINESDLNRTQIVEWFKNERDAILLNVGIFTTGFDVTDVEAVIVNRATTSLSLWLQIVGRGARTTDKIYKDSFICIDGGGNIEMHQSWSSQRDWKKIFYEGLTKPKRKKDDAINIKECKGCGALFDAKTKECPECGHVEPEKPKKDKKEIEVSASLMASVPIPNAKKIINYTLRNKEDLHFAFSILIAQIVDLFKFHEVEERLYIANGGKRIKELVRGCYFEFYKELPRKQDRSMNYLIDKINKNLQEYYAKN